MGMRLKPNRGSHLPILMKAVYDTTGPILELGCGLYSTTPLHWACWVPKRKLVTYESNPDYYDFLNRYETEFHEVHCITDWDAIDISGPWSVAFIDHEPAPRRGIELERLQHAEYVVAHDSEGRNDHKYGLSRAAPLFKYKYEYGGAFPHTTVYSNAHDLADFLGECK